jgi:hypothetical protein
VKKHLVLLSVLFTTSSIYAKREVFARSFMYTKPGYYDVVMEQALWHDIEFNKKGTTRAGFQAIPFFQNSLSLDKNARYFLMKGKTELLVSGDANVADLESRDIRAEWINLPSTFRGFLSVNPKQEQKGCLFEYNQDLGKWFETRFLHDMYILFLLPVSVVKNNINLTQTDVQNPQTEFPQDIIQAFNQPSWNFSRIDNCQKKKIGVAELTIKFGSCYMSEDFFQLNYYTVIAIPTGNKQNGKTMFEPVNGNNHHLGIGGGINMQVPFNRDTTSFAFCGFVDLESVILIRNKQFRTYDLFDKPWSRFLLMNVIEAQPNTNQPGVNYMTQRITAKPFNVVDFALGWRFHTPTMEAEIGYGIWGHANERTNLKQPSPFQIVGQNGTTPVISDQPVVFGIAGSAPGKTASKSTIAFRAPDDLDFVPILTSDFDPQSGESYGGFTQRAFGSIGWINKGVACDTILGAGWSVDVPFHNSLLQLWKVWLKLAATF